MQTGSRPAAKNEESRGRFKSGRHKQAAERAVSASAKAFTVVNLTVN
jgi:hypothetical protein